MQAVLAVATVLSCLYWWLVSARMLRTQRKVAVLDSASPLELPDWPRVSLIVPACNEEVTLERAVTSRLKDDYPDLEVILVNDRSTDGTKHLVDEIASRDHRVVPIHLTQLPDGWLGKVHALHRGTAVATGKWLLFSDADVEFAPGTLRRVVADAETRGLDHLAAIPRFLPSNAVLDATIDTFMGGLLAMIDIAAVEDPHSRVGIGGGAFSMVRRTALQRSPGFEWLKLEVADDVVLGQMLKRHGARQSVVSAPSLISLHWYKTVGDMARGLEKNTFGVLGHYRLAPLLVVCSIILALALGPFVGAALANALWARALSVATIVMGIIIRMRFNHWLGRRIAPVLLFPLGAILVVAMAIRAGLVTIWRGGVVWRGTLYPTEQLRKNMRLQFF